MSVFQKWMLITDSFHCIRIAILVCVSHFMDLFINSRNNWAEIRSMKHKHDTNAAKIKETVQTYFPFMFSKIIRRHYLFRAEQFSFRNLFDFNILQWRIHRKFGNWNFHKHIEHMQAFHHLGTSPYNLYWFIKKFFGSFSFFYCFGI